MEFQENNAEHNQEVLSKLEKQPAIPKKGKQGGFLGVYYNYKNSGQHWDARIGINYKRCKLGSYATAEDAGEAYATAKWFVEQPKRDAVQQKVEAAAAVVPDSDSYKFSNYDFHESPGRSHHDSSQDPPMLPPGSRFTQAQCDQMHAEMKALIEASLPEAGRRLTEKYKNRRKSVPFAEVLADENSPIRKFFDKVTYKSEEELDAAVRAVVGDDKSLANFYLCPLKEETDFVSYKKYARYMSEVYTTVRQNVLLSLGLFCYYCGNDIWCDYYKKWYAYTYEHLQARDDKAFKRQDLVELMKCVPCCLPCNPKGDKDRKFHIDYFQEVQILVPDSELEREEYHHRSIDDILDSEAFNGFYKEAEEMGLEYTGKIDDDGYPVTSGAKQGRVANYLELKLLLWKWFPGILLDDIVLFRKISDYQSPRYTFRTTVITLIKVLTNQCPGVEEGGGKCTGWRNLRNLRPWEYTGVHYDHDSGDGRESKDNIISAMKFHDWKIFIAEIRKCCVLCAECHMGN